MNHAASEANGGAPELASHELLTYQEYIDDKAAAMLSAAAESRTETPRPPNREVGLERCSAMLSELQHAANMLYSTVSPATLGEYAQLFVALNQGEDVDVDPNDLVSEYFWRETIIENLVHERPINLELYPVQSPDPNTLGPHYAATDLSIATLLRQMSPGVNIFANSMGYTNRQLLTRNNALFVYDMDNIGYTHPLAADRPIDTSDFNNSSTKRTEQNSNPRVIVDTLISVARQSGVGHMKEDAEGGITFYPAESPARHFGRSDPHKIDDILKNGIQLKMPGGAITGAAYRTANFMRNVDDALWISIGDEEQNDENLATDIMLSQIIQRDRRQQFTYPSRMPEDVVMLTVLKMLQYDIKKYASVLQKDLDFRKMPTAHPYVYIDQNYGKEVKHYPEGIFPNDLLAMEWLLEHLGDIIPEDYEEGLVYTDVGRGPFSLFDVIAAKFASEIRLIEPAEPNLAVMKDWKDGMLRKRYDVGPKFEAALARRNPMFAGSEQEARKKALIIPGGIEDLATSESDLIFEGFVTCSRARDRRTYWEDNRRLERALRRSRRSRIVSYNMKGSTGWFGFPAIPIDENMLYQARLDAGLEVIGMETINAAALPRGHSEMIISVSSLRRKPWRYQSYRFI